ncbi:MAG TPA: cytochrome c biogenesis protein CcsA [Chitinophagales bacterium]|nr:cytochrome c biogenesis protein CcsA [Chitinophagales bacterium]
MNIYAEGSNLIYGQIGHLFVITFFIAAIASSLSYFFAVKKSAVPNEASIWLKAGRMWYILHAFTVIGAAAIVIIMIQQHVFEYKYIWQHSSRELPLNYLLSAFWEGQEGSTLLWLFWHSIIGIVLIFRAKKWEAPVMAILTLSQVMLASMELGIYIKIPNIQLDFSPFIFAFNWADYKVGSNLFSLVKDTMDIPVFSMDPNYVFEDGNGLNPLLQNYWMVIHPPTLFLGFATTTVPFAYALSSLWLRNYKDWLQPALSWTLFSLAILGTGVLMGGAWAYEALSFGGFWAWDPVENASIVPWLVMAAGLHTALAYKHTGYSLIPTYGFLLSGMLFVLYSSFMTKSGVLGDSSVHSFTDMGMSAQLILSIAVFLIPSLWLLFKRYKEIPGRKDEESVTSREFWLFIGSLVFLVSALHIIIFTSFPVINKIIGSNIAPPDPTHYNSVEIWIAIMLAIGSAVTQFFSYKKTKVQKVLKAIFSTLIVSIALSIPVIYYFKFYRLDYLVLTVTAIYAVIANGYYLIKTLKGNIYHAGGSITHIGFGIFLLGILISQGRQHVVSLNKFGINYGDSFSEEENAENILLYIDEPQMMSGYRVTYLGDSAAKPNVYFKVQYEKLNDKKEVIESFILTPNVQMNPTMGNVPNPSTKKTLDKDLYTHITTAPLNEDGSPADTLLIESNKVAMGDTVFASRSFAIFESINPKATSDKMEVKANDILVGARLRLFTADTSYVIEPKYFIRELMASSIPEYVESLGVKFSLTKIYPEDGQVEITIEQKLKKFIIMKAIIFPYINLLWLGSLVMVIGVFMSLRKRYSENKRMNAI